MYTHKLKLRWPIHGFIITKHAPSADDVHFVQSFGGFTKQFKHTSETLGCEMKFTIFFPPGVLKAPILYFLSGLTCTDRNFIEKVRTLPRRSEAAVPALPNIVQHPQQQHCRERSAQ